MQNTEIIMSHTVSKWVYVSLCLRATATSYKAYGVRDWKREAVLDDLNKSDKKNLILYIRKIQIYSHNETHIKKGANQNKQ